MAIKYLGETLDIHAGGIDLIFPHHENEIAQSESLTGKPFARFWLHAEFLMVEGQKMSKSLGNYYTLRDMLASGYAPEAIRYLLASVPYRKQLNFTFDGLQSRSHRHRPAAQFQAAPGNRPIPEGVEREAGRAHRRSAAQRSATAMDDDLNTAEALAAVFEYIRDANSAMDAGEFRAGNAAAALEFLDALRFRLRRAAAHRREPAHGRCRSGIADRGAQRRQEGARISRAPIRSASSCWNRASFWRTPRPACAGRGK